MSISRKKKEVLSLIGKMDETHLDALLLLLREPLGNDYELNDEEWKEAERRLREVKKDKIKLVPAREAARRIENKLKKRR